MPKKKKLTEPEISKAEEPVIDTGALDAAVIGLPEKKEPLLTVTVDEDFKDGALAARFAKYGYGVLWKKGETRSIPIDLFVRCKRSGARFVL
jgi:hypothetical protein